MTARHYTNSQNSIVSLWVCWFFGKNLSNFVLPAWKLYNPYYHNMIRPRSCPQEGCRSQTFTEMRTHASTLTINSQMIRLQENSGNSGGRIPRTVNCHLIRDLCDSGGLHLFKFLAVWITWFISSWEENNCCQSWANFKNDSYFHSKWQLLTILSENSCHFVNLLSLRYITWFNSQQPKTWKCKPSQLELETWSGLLQWLK